MRLLQPTEAEEQYAEKAYGYKLLYVSENRKWHIAVKPVIFGFRAVAYEADSIGCAIDYCAADQPVFLMLLIATLRAIFLHLPEQMSSTDMYRFMPSWRVRPINCDPCWDELQDLADKLKEGTITVAFDDR
jgi:hypothetical protein